MDCMISDRCLFWLVSSVMFCSGLLLIMIRLVSVLVCMVFSLFLCCRIVVVIEVVEWMVFRLFRILVWIRNLVD